jgi:bifunctional DNA-binding transcriptional regulator/antitoxin component of YhaV-PrlF toxin-antitoxin module
MVGREVSRITKANKISSSARTTIPKKVMDGLKLDIGDIVEWELRTDKGETIAHVKKLK